jgi:nucleotide-binding universal stress UspA family protein
MNYLVPIDFSEQSLAAADYAAALTRIWPGNLHFLHIILPVREESSYVNVKTLNVQKNTVFEIFNLQERIRRTFDARSGSELVSGELSSTVIRTSRKEKSDLIVMGMQGTSGLRDYLYGSHTMEMIEETTLPLLVVPNECSFKPFRHIVYITDYQAGETSDLIALGKIAAKFKALLSVISINTLAVPSSRLEFRDRIKSEIPFAAIHFEDREDESGVAEGLLNFALTESVDLIGVNTSHSDLVRKMAGRNLMTDTQFTADIPVLFFPGS